MLASSPLYGAFPHRVSQSSSLSIRNRSRVKPPSHAFRHSVKSSLPHLGILWDWGCGNLRFFLEEYFIFTPDVLHVKRRVEGGFKSHDSWAWFFDTSLLPAPLHLHFACKLKEAKCHRCSLQHWFPHWKMHPRCFQGSCIPDSWFPPLSFTFLLPLKTPNGVARFVMYVISSRN